eukprot:scaffold629711_cov15-Prasinocladus_malaysianus.AAC.1
MDDAESGGKVRLRRSYSYSYRTRTRRDLGPTRTEPPYYTFRTATRTSTRTPDEARELGIIVICPVTTRTKANNKGTRTARTWRYEQGSSPATSTTTVQTRVAKKGSRVIAPQLRYSYSYYEYQTDPTTLRGFGYPYSTVLVR